MLQRITRHTRGISFVVRRHFPVAPMWFHKILDADFRGQRIFPAISKAYRIKSKTRVDMPVTGILQSSIEANK
jgi:hypothetical protein